MPATLNSRIKSLQSLCVDDKALQLQLQNEHRAILYSYPKDNTSGSTKQAQEFSSLITQFKQCQCQVVGVSRDSLSSNYRFIEKVDIKFPLISESVLKTL